MARTMLSTAAVVFALMQSRLALAQGIKTLPNIAANCNKWHIAVSGEGCYSAYSAAGITAQQFFAWNPDVPTTCASNYLPDYSYCVGIDPSISITKSSTTSKSSSTAPSTQQPSPPSGGIKTLPNVAANCNKWHIAVSGEGCYSAYSAAGITAQQFFAWNPDVPTTCASNFLPDYAYCVGVDPTLPTTRPSTTSKSSTSSSTASKSSTKPPTPTSNTDPYTIAHPVTSWKITSTSAETSFPPSRTQTGQPGNCNDWHLVSGGETCQSIRNRYRMDMDDLLDWNPSLMDDCSGLQLGWWVCIHLQPQKQASIVFNNPETPVVIPTGSSSYTDTVTSQLPDFTPVPSHGPMPSDCVSWHFAKAGDRCDNVLAKNPLMSRSQFFQWNPVLNGNCDGLWTGVYYCVWAGSLGDALPAPPTVSTRPGNTPGDSTANCVAWYQATNGDDCKLITDMFGRFSQTDFVSWNPSVDSTCSGIRDDTYYCVGVPGTPTTRTSAGPSPTAPPVEAPTQSGLAADCSDLWLVSSLDSCESIARSKGIALSDFYKWNPSVAGTGSTCAGLKAGYNVCVMVKGGSGLPPSATGIGRPTTTTASGTTSASSAGPSTSSAPSSTPTGNPLVVSKDGTCSGTNKYTCAGSSFGSCCSSSSWCGDTAGHCGAGCQTGFSSGCAANSDKISPDGSCGGDKGYICLGSGLGDCCSQYGWCGDSGDHCGAGCQGGFGKCS